jgi:hypothetical protein
MDNHIPPEIVEKILLPLIQVEYPHVLSVEVTFIETQGSKIKYYFTKIGVKYTDALWMRPNKINYLFYKLKPYFLSDSDQLRFEGFIYLY